MFTAQNYVVASTLDEAWELNQKRGSTILGGCGWLKMGHRMMQTAIDLSALGLDKIEETDAYFSLGAMVTLRQMETNAQLQAYFGSCIAESVQHIVGVQFRNGATIGGSIWGRFGFSDVLTVFLALDAEVVLHHAGVVSLRQFVEMPYDRDVLVAVRLPKRQQKTVYLTHRAAATDFPVLAVALCQDAQGEFGVAIGARPMRAVWLPLQAGQAGAHCAKVVKFDSNLRGSAAYRTHLCEVLVNRAMDRLTKQEA